jgi:two-component system, LuxR family, response regulator FixJ
VFLRSCFLGSLDFAGKTMNEDAKRILLVLDDDAAVRDSLKFLLEVEGFEVRTFASPDQLLNGKGIPDVGCLIVDDQMPAVNGLDVVATLRQRQNHMPAILTTAHPNAKILGRASAGAMTLIKKPFQQAALLDCTNRLLS